MQTGDKPAPKNQTALVIGGLVAIAAIAGLVWLGVWYKDRQARTETLVAVKKLAKLPGFDIEGHSTQSKAPRPTPDEINSLLGREPDEPINPKADKTVAKFSWKSPKKEFSIYVVYKKNKQGRLEMAKATVFGNP